MPLRILCCSKCTLRTKSLVAYVDHCKLHSNVPNAAFPCGVSRCIQTFKTFAGFKSHMTRCHGSIRNAVRYEQTYREGAGPSYECAVLHCKQICHSLSNFIVHIKDHINTKTAVVCPFLSCHTKFEDVKVTTFNAHLSRYHKGWAHRTVDDRYLVSASSSSTTALDMLCRGNVPPVQDIEYDSEEDLQLETECKLSDADMENLLLKKLALFTLNLQVKHHVASSIVQVIISEFGDLLFTNMNAVNDKILSLISCITPPDTADSVIQAIHSHPLSATLDMKSGPLRSEHTRTCFYKKNFNYVEPLTISLGTSAASGESKAFHYIPIVKSLQALYADTAIHEHLKTSDVCSSTVMTDHVLRDFNDGSLCQASAFLQNNPGAVQILLYQDEFEVVNPIGVARGKHKLLAVYYSLGNLHPSVRSKIDGLQLVLLCKSQYLQEFGEEAVFQPLVDDLIRLKQEGIDLGPQYGIRRGTVVFAIGDNLGSHMLGGFVQSFSGKFFCRFCLATRDCLKSGKCMPDEFAVRTPEKYDDALTYIEQNCVECFEGSRKNLCYMLCPNFMFVHQHCPHVWVMICSKALFLLI
jgi:hypothetical protein